MKTALIAGILISFTVSPKLTYEGRLYTAEGKVYSGQADFTLRLYTQSEGGVPIWEETKSVDVKDGFFSTSLGENTPLPDPFPSTLWMGIEVNSSGEMSPRIELTSAPYSLLSDKALSTSRTAFHIQHTEEIFLEWCVSDPTTCCSSPNQVNYLLPSATINGEIGGNILVSFSTSVQADNSGNSGEKRGYYFYLFVDGHKVHSSMRACVAESPWGMCNVAITYFLPDLPYGNHTFEVKYCAMFSTVTGYSKVWEYNFDVIQLP